MCVAALDKAPITVLCVVSKTDFSCYYLKSQAEIVPWKSFTSPFAMATSRLLFETETTLASAWLLSKMQVVTVHVEQSCSCHFCCPVRMAKWRATGISVEIPCRGKLKDRILSVVILSGSRALGMRCEELGRGLGQAVAGHANVVCQAGTHNNPLFNLKQSFTI